MHRLQEPLPLNQGQWPESILLAGNLGVSTPGASPTLMGQFSKTLETMIAINVEIERTREWKNNFLFAILSVYAHPAAKSMHYIGRLECLRLFENVTCLIYGSWGILKQQQLRLVQRQRHTTSIWPGAVSGFAGCLGALSLYFKWFKRQTGSTKVQDLYLWLVVQSQEW